MNKSDTTGTGWQCLHCHRWIQSGIIHDCPNWTQSVVQPIALERIAQALESIAERLNQLTPDAIAKELMRLADK